jgi:hypothetical protein
VNRIALLLNALAFGSIGVFAFVWPESLAALIGMALQQPAAITDVRATYGGFEIALALFFILTSRSQKTEVVRAAILLGALAFSGFAASRFYGLAADGHEEFITWCLVSIESIGALMNWALYLTFDRGDRKHGEA